MENQVAWRCPKCRKTYSVQVGFEPIVCEECSLKPSARTHKYAQHVATKPREATAMEGCANACCILMMIAGGLSLLLLPLFLFFNGLNEWTIFIAMCSGLSSIFLIAVGGALSALIKSARK